MTLDLIPLCPLKVTLPNNRELTKKLMQRGTLPRLFQRALLRSLLRLSSTFSQKESKMPTTTMMMWSVPRLRAYGLSATASFVRRAKSILKPKRPFRESTRVLLYRLCVSVRETMVLVSRLPYSTVQYSTELFWAPVTPTLFSRLQSVYVALGSLIS